MGADPVQVAPRHVRVVLENDHVRVLRVFLRPGEIVPMHSHPPYLSVFLTSGVLHNTPAGGRPELVRTIPGATAWSDGVEHVTQNPGPLPVEMLVVEFKGRASASPKGPAIRPA